jgi:1-acyl-sn-glycerol-3-phosphate acyltransferase
MLKYPRILAICGPRLLWDFAFHLNGYARHPERKPIAYRYRVARNLIIFILHHYRIDWKVEGMAYLQDLNDQNIPFLMAPNHESDLDPLALCYLSDKPLSFVAKVETKKMPFIGTAVKSLSGFFMDRSDLRQSFEVIKGVQTALEKKFCSYILFPEGTRNKQPQTTDVLPFHPGSMKAAMAVGAPILPVAIYGSFRPFQWKPDFKRNLVQFTFLKPWTKEDYEGKTTAEVALAIHDQVQAEVNRQKALDKIYMDKGYEKVPLRKGPLPIK